MTVKAVLTADNHLNKHYRTMRPDQLEKRRTILSRNFDETVDTAIRERVDLYLHAGDLFDMPSPKNQALIRVAQRLRELYDEGIRAYMIAGTHDMPKMRGASGGAAPQRIFQAQGHAKFFSETDTIETQKVIIDGLEVVVGGISVDPTLEDQDPLEGKAFGESGDINILLVHYGIEGHVPYRSKDPVISRKTIAELGADLICSGHIHDNRIFRIGETTVVIPGATERMGFGEREKTPGFYFLDIGRDGVDAEFIKLDCQPMIELKVNVGDLYGDPNEILINRIRDESSEETLLKLKLQGTVPRSLYHRLKLHKLFVLGNELNFNFTIDDSLILESFTEDFEGGRLSQKEEIISISDVMMRDKTEFEKDILRSARDLVLKMYDND
ncbi:MAG: metallophosphoesterase family protein [Halobacteriota archaeon]|nr:metallophosphoesterase family protein [Halobacteriota archaeon]